MSAARARRTAELLGPGSGAELPLLWGADARELRPRARADGRVSTRDGEVADAEVEGHPHRGLLTAALRARAWRSPEGTAVMGVVNVTPDSFSDGGLWLDPQRAVEHGLQLEAEGASVLDIGGESTRPGAEPVPAAEEIRRVVPVLEALRARSDALLSIDTMKAEVAEAALEAGADWVNDVSGGLHDPRILEVTAAAGAGSVAMHRQGDSRTMQEDPRYADCVSEVAEHLRTRAAVALEAGIAHDRVLLDPGIGFGKLLEHNLALLARGGELASLGAPLLIGPSRKAFIGQVKGAERADAWRTGARADRPADRVGGTAAALAACVRAGVAVVRVHDVAAMVEAVRVSEALLGAEEPPIRARGSAH